MKKKYVKMMAVFVATMMLVTNIQMEFLVLAAGKETSEVQSAEEYQIQDEMNSEEERCERLKEEECKKIIEEAIEEKNNKLKEPEEINEIQEVVVNYEIDYKPFIMRTTCPETSNSYYFSAENPFYPTYAPSPGQIDALGNCTWYAWGRAYEILGEKPRLSTGNAGGWYSYNYGKYEYSPNVPKVGAIACWENHVAVVEKVNADGTIMISESSYKIEGVTEGIRFAVRDNLCGWCPDNYGDNFQGYIYLGNFGGEILNGSYKGLNWSVTKQGVLTLSGTASEAFDNEDWRWDGWIGYIKNFNNVEIKKVIVDISWDKIYSTACWFNYGESIQEIEFKNINTSQVTNMSCMFNNCESLGKIDVSNFDTSNVTNMSNMFSGCDKLLKLDISGFNTSNVINMSSMFESYDYWEEGSLLQELDVSGFDTSKVTDMSNMFSGCKNVKELDVSGFDTSKVTDMSGMFHGCNSVKKLDISGFDTSKVTDMSWMFSGCNNVKELDVSGFDTSKVTDMSSMFRPYTWDGGNLLQELDVSGFDTSKVTDMSGMFSGCNDVKELDISGFDTSKVTDMSGMFSSCNNVKELDVSGFDTSNVTDMSRMFNYCTNVQELDVSGFDTNKVTDMSSMFGDCFSIKELDVSNFDTSKVTDMSSMFDYCTNVQELDVSGFDTSKVTDISYMFSCCSDLEELDVSNFDTSNVTDMHGMFRRCDYLQELDLSNFDMSKVTNVENMLSGVNELKILKTPRNLQLNVIFLCGYYDYNWKYYTESFSMYDATGKEYTELPREMSESITLYRDIENIPEDIDIIVNEDVIRQDEFQVKVIDDKNMPVADATVDYNGLCVLTDGSGVATIKNYEAGKSLTIEKYGYAPRCVKKFQRNAGGKHTYVLDARFGSILFTLNGRDTELLDTKKIINKAYKDTLFDVKIISNDPSVLSMAIYSGKRQVAYVNNILDNIADFNDLCFKDFQAGEKVTVKAYNYYGNLVFEEVLNLEVISEDKIPSSISMGNGVKIKMGSDVPLIGGMELEIALDDLPITYEETADKRKILIGKEFLDLFKKSDDSFFETIKKLDKDTYSQFLDKFRNKEAAKPEEGANNLKFDWDINGYLECSKDLETYSGKIYVEGSVSKTKENQRLVAGVPVVVELSIEGKVNAAGQIEMKLQEGIAGSVSVGGGVEIGLYAGVGVANLASAGIYGTAEFNMEYQLLPISESKINEAYLEGKVGLQVKMFGKSVGKLVMLDGRYYIVRRDTSQLSEVDSQVFNIDYDAVYPDVVMGNDNIEAWGTGESRLNGALSENVLQDSVSADVDPQVIVTDSGVIMMGYLINSDERSVGNKSTLVYSLYEDGTWKTPITVYDNGTADFNPDFYSDGKDIYVVWQDAGRELGSEMTLNQIAGSLDLSIAKYDSETETFALIDTLSNEEQLLKQQPQIVAKDGRVKIFWHENETDNVMGLTGTNLYYSAELIQNLDTITELYEIEEVFSELIEFETEETSEDTTEEFTEIETEETSEDTTEEFTEIETEETSEETTEEYAEIETEELGEEITEKYAVTKTEGSGEEITEEYVETETEESGEETTEEYAETETEESGEETTEEYTETEAEESSEEITEEFTGTATEEKKEVSKEVKSEKVKENNILEWNVECIGQTTYAVTSSDAGIYQDKICFVTSDAILDDVYNVTSGHITLWNEEDSSVVSNGSGSNVQFEKLYGNKTLTWWENGDIYYLNESGNSTSLLGENMLQCVDYKILEDAVGNPAVIYALSGNDCSELYWIRCEEEKCLPAVCLSTEEQYIQNVDGFGEGNGFQLVYNKMTVEDLEEQSNFLCTGKVEAKIIDLELQKVSVLDYYNEDNAQQVMQTYFTIRNNGTEDIESVTVLLKDENGSIVTTRQLGGMFKAGEEEVVLEEIPLSLLPFKGVYTFELVEVQGEHKVDNNTASTEIGNSCLNVSTEVVRVGSGDVIQIAVRNTGLEECAGTIRILDDEKGTEYWATEFETLSTGQSIVYTCNIPASAFSKREAINLNIEVVPSIEQENTDILLEKLTVSAPEFTVCFEKENEEPEYIFGVSYGSTVSFPENPVKDGYYFAGWYTQDGICYTEETKITEDVTLQPKWNAEQIVVSVDRCSVMPIAEQYYTGKAVKPTVTVKYGNALLKNGKDYSLSYVNNVECGTATVIITGKGSFTGTMERTYKIYYDITKASANKVNAYDYTGSNIEPTVQLKFKSQQLRKGSDYTVSYSNNKDAGTACITITGKGKYRGKKEIFFTIKGVNISGMRYGKISGMTYNGKAQKASVKVSDKSGNILRQGVDYQLVYQNTEKVGTATVIVIGMGNYSGSKKITYKITPADFTKAEVEIPEALEYTGKNVMISPKVKWNDILLAENTDYTVTYKNNRNSGSASVIVTGKGNYKGKLTKTFTIEPINLSEFDDVRIDVPDVSYTNKALKPKVTVYCGNVKLGSKDYTVAYSNNVDIGVGTVTITGKGNYKGVKTAEFRIVEKSRMISNCKLEKMPSMNYEGIPATPDVVIKDGEYTLQKEKDYQLFYEKNDGAGTASVIIKGIGNYAGTKKTSFKITAKQLADKDGVLGDNISILPIENVWYNGYAQKIKVDITDGEKVLREGVDYTLKYKNNTKPGTATVTITGKKSYSGKITKSFVIDSWDFEDLSISISDLTYNGKAQKPTPQFMLNGESINIKAGTVYKITYSDNKDAGYAKAVIKGAGDYVNAKPITVHFYINKMDIEDAVVGNISNQTYKGTLVKPIPKVKAGGLTLRHNKDFVVNYFGNGKKGEATIIISGIGNFEGACEKKFIIQ